MEKVCISSSENQPRPLPGIPFWAGADIEPHNTESSKSTTNQAPLDANRTPGDATFPRGESANGLDRQVPSEKTKPATELPPQGETLDGRRTEGVDRLHRTHMNEEHDSRILNSNIPYEPIDQAEMEACHKLCTRRGLLTGQAGLFSWLVMTGELETFLNTTDERQRRKSDWQSSALWRLLALFSVVRNADGSFHWKQHPLQFNGMWRRTPRQELMDFFGTESDYVITTTLSVWESYGLIERRHPTINDKKWRTLWIRFRVEKVAALLEQAKVGIKRDKMGWRRSKRRGNKIEKLVSSSPDQNNAPQCIYVN